jgi:serine/threonine protein kinase
MAIPSGTKLGTYKVTSQIGAGGMGEVYQAHDSKLGRDVAIKVLPEQFARDPERLARFQREAKLLAALNHPNIATIHGLEQSGDTHYLVMELVPGETLRERITREGPLPVQEALTIARQIAEALEAAHGSEKAIIHRDLKPANVKVTPEGRVKVLDFGLAKAFSPHAATEDPSNSPTLSMNPTMQGVIMGTAAYMSPEQARGRAVTMATDIFAFGAVLYEMLTGRQAFQGEDASLMLAAVMKSEPDWERLPSDLPPAVRTYLQRCLRKEIRQRVQAIGDMRLAMEGAFDLPIGSPRQAPTPVLPVTRMVINPPLGVQLTRLEQPAVAISPDGSHIAYVGMRDNIGQIYLRPMNRFDAWPIAGTEGAINPFFSPDGQWLGFWAGAKFRKVLVSGGAALDVARAASSPRGASWGSRGIIVFAPVEAGTLQQILAAGGTPQPATTLEQGDVSHRWPEFLPDGHTVLFATGLGTPSQLAVQSIRTGDRRNLGLQGSSPRYLSSGHLIYAQLGALMAVPFDVQRLEVTGTPVPVVQGLVQSSAYGDAQYAVSAHGTLVYVPGGIDAGEKALVWVDRQGVEQAVAAPARPYRYPKLSPDGQRVAVTIEESESHIWLYDLSRNTLTRLTFGGSPNLMGAWMPDGMRIVFGSNVAGTFNIFWQPADGSGPAERLGGSENITVPCTLSPDGQAISYVEVRPDTGYGIGVLRLSDSGPEMQSFLRPRFTEGAPVFSPDGRWLAYVSDESGRIEVYVQPYPGHGGKWQISTEGGTEPVWNPNGRELFYRSGDKMMVVEVTTQGAFSAGRPQMLFEATYQHTPGTFPNYDVAPDGQRFLMLKASEQEQAAAQINVVQNWFEELKQRVPTGTK